MSESNIDGTPGVLLRSANGGTYFVPHTDLGRYRLADEATAAVPQALSGSVGSTTDVSVNVKRLEAYEVPLIHDAASGAAGFPTPESDVSFPAPEGGVNSFPTPEAGANAFPVPEGGANAFPVPEGGANAFPVPEAMASVAGFPTPEASGATASFPAPEADSGGPGFPTPESEAATFPVPEASPVGFPTPESSSSDD